MSTFTPIFIHVKYIYHFLQIFTPAKKVWIFFLIYKFFSDLKVVVKLMKNCRKIDRKFHCNYCILCVLVQTKMKKSESNGCNHKCYYVTPIAFKFKFESGVNFWCEFMEYKTCIRPYPLPSYFKITILLIYNLYYNTKETIKVILNFNGFFSHFTQLF